MLHFIDPFASSYLPINVEAQLPPYPVEKACRRISKYANVHETGSDGRKLLNGMVDAIALFYNASR